MEISEKEFQKFVLQWSEKNLRKFPWRKKKVSTYEIFVAEVLLKRTTAKAAATVYEKFLEKFPNIKRLAKSYVEKIEEVIRPIGYPQRAWEIKSSAIFLVENFGSEFPNIKETLLQIPFVGHYTSNAILSLAFNKPYPMLDSNVNRILSRVYLGSNPAHNITKNMRELAQAVLPRSQHRTFNFAMLDIGGTICLPRNPKCTICPLVTLCKFAKIKN